MTCASCANRIERKLNKLDGVVATVNYATEKARVSHPADASSTDDLLATVAAAGYAARLPAPPTAGRPGGRDDADAEPADPLRQRLLVSAAADRAGRAALAMVPALQFTQLAVGGR